MKEALTRASFKQKEINTLPKGAKILNKEITINVEEIENGFLVCKSYEIKYEFEKRTDYTYYNKKYFSKENPLSINLKGMDKTLADNFK